MLERRPGPRAAGFRLYRRMDFRAGEEWFSLPFVMAPAALDGAARRGTTGSFFFLRILGFSILFCIDIPGQGIKISAQAIQRVAALRFLFGIAFGTLGVFLYSEPRCAAFACALMLLACYNTACGLLYGASRADALPRGGVRPPQPEARLQGS